jgi:hypothetical protein
MIHRIKHLRELRSNIIFEVPTLLHRDFPVLTDNCQTVIKSNGSQKIADTELFCYTFAFSHAVNKNTLNKESIPYPTCDDKGVFTDDDTYREE